jgi:hypothetical protein
MARNLTAASAAHAARRRRDDAAATGLGARTPAEGDARPLVGAPTGDDTLGETDEELPVPRTIDRP